MADHLPSLSRRDFMRLAGGAGVAAVAGKILWTEGYADAAGTGGASSLGTGIVPEQVHLTYGADPATAMTVSWVSPAAETNPTILLDPPSGGPIAVPATAATYTDGLSGETVYAYHGALGGLMPGTTYGYTVTSEGSAATFAGQFTTAPSGRFPFLFTSFGDLGTPGAGATYQLADGSTITSSTYSESQWNAYTAVNEVESLAPLFHLLNGDLCYADKVAITSTGATTTAGGAQAQPEVWRDFGLNVSRSAAHRPWMPCLGNHEAELDNGPQGYDSYLTRYHLPGNGTAHPGNFYSFQVGSVLVVALDANDVCYQGAGGYNVGGVATTDAAGTTIPATAHVYNQFYTGTFRANPDGTLSPGGTTPNAQTTWLESTLAAARAGTSVDWIVVQMHQAALSSSADNGCDAAIRQAWVPLFDRYQVDLVVNGHDHDYERSKPVRGFTPNLGTSTFTGGSVTNAQGTSTLPATKGQTVNTFTPSVVTSDTTSPIDTTLGTVYLTLGGGGTDKRDNTYNAGTANVTTFTQIRTGATKPVADASEPCTWSAVTDATDAYGIAAFSLDPGQPGGDTTISVTYYHAPTQTAGTPDYSVYDTFQLTRPRADNPPPALPELPDALAAAGAVAVIGGGALVARQVRRGSPSESTPSEAADEPASEAASDPE